MKTRRRFVLAIAATLGASIGYVRASGPTPQIWVPLAVSATTPVTAPSGSLIGSPSGTVDQAINWFAARAPAAAIPPIYLDPARGIKPYDRTDITAIVTGYRNIGESVGIDWFLALAQMSHETGALTSFWSLRPQRNPAGIGVDGTRQTVPPVDPTGWAYNYQRNFWEKGLSFDSWETTTGTRSAIEAHLGRLLAYRYTDAEADAVQLALITRALSYRPLYNHRGSATTIYDLSGTWAADTSYGTRVMDVLNRMLRE